MPEDAGSVKPFAGDAETIAARSRQKLIALQVIEVIGRAPQRLLEEGTSETEHRRTQLERTGWRHGRQAHVYPTAGLPACRTAEP
jgi:hypothetical protein